MSPDPPRRAEDAAIEKIASDVLRYLIENPSAMDTKDAIAKWWIARQRITESVEDVGAALARLTARGEVKEMTLPDGTKVYGRAKRAGSPQ
jgi:hypothetical protein